VSRPLHKRRSLLEHQWPWLVSSLLAALLSAALVVAIDGGFLEEYASFPAILRGYTLTGLFFGVCSLALALLTFLYSLRKRSLQEKLPLGTMAGWLWGHVYLGLSCVVLALAHAGYGTVGLELTVGRGLLVCLVVLVVSGLIWRVVYAVVPAKAASDVGHYSQSASHVRAQNALVEIEKLSAGRSPALQQMVQWLLQVTASDPEVAHAARSVPQEDQVVIAELVRLSRTRHHLVEREKRQAKYRRRLQGLRVLHVPFSLLFLLLLPLHVVSALDLPAKLAPRGGVLGSTLGGYHPSSACRSCHQRVVDEWRTSMHAHALTSPIMIAQTNLAHRETLQSTSAPDPQNVCVNCHGPIATALAQSPLLPFSPQGALAEPDLLSEGVTCSVCHQWQGEPQTAGAGLTAFQDGLKPGRTFFGSIDDPVGNAFHQSEATPLFQRDSSQLCRNCHSVQYDRNGDGKIERGTDLVLQTLYDEWEDYAKAGGPVCVDCHMPIAPGSRAAETALIPLEQDGDAPARQLRSHRFVAVDYPLDLPAARDESRAAREELLRRAATLAIVPTSLAVTPTRVSFDVSLRNTGVGHNLPGGFAFVRQMWLEVALLTAQGQAVAASGLVRLPTDDLCDASLLEAPNELRPFVVGCTATDRQLVSFQQQLVDKTELFREASGAVLLDLRQQPRLRAAPGSKEVVVQYLTGGAVPRVRPSTGTLTSPLIVGEQRSFPYVFDLPAGSRPTRVQVRLLFRAVPPYFLRALGKTQTPADGPSLTALVQNVEINEMSRVEAALPSAN
jgi:Cytochrome c554 and c-prime